MRKPKGVTFEKPGDVVQIDTLSISFCPASIKQFTAYDPFAKWTVARPYKRATAKNAAEFLDASGHKCPIPSELSKSTEAASSWPCSSKPAPTTIPLYVLPPRSPKLNGAVERCNGAWRYEFYACSDLPSHRQNRQTVGAFQHLYNNHRPHGALAGKTPAEYLSIRRANETPPSHMS